MNVLIADSRISTAPLLAAELRGRNVSVTLAVPEKQTGRKQEHHSQPNGGSQLNEIAWNPLSWLSTESLVFEASARENLDALVLCFDLNGFSPEFSKSPLSGIFGGSVIAFQNLLDSAVKKFQRQKEGRIVFALHSRSAEQSKSLPLSGMHYIAAVSAEAAFIRCAEETAAVFSKPDDSSIQVFLFKTPFDIPTLASHILDSKPARNSGKWISPSGGIGRASIFPRKI